VDSILVGPGMLPDQPTKKLVRKLLINHPEKKTVLDAGALRAVDYKWLHKNCVITPHKQEFKSLFGQEPTIEAAHKISGRCPAVIILKDTWPRFCGFTATGPNTTSLSLAAAWSTRWTSSPNGIIKNT